MKACNGRVSSAAAATWSAIGTLKGSPLPADFCLQGLWPKSPARCSTISAPCPALLTTSVSRSLCCPVLPEGLAQCLHQRGPQPSCSGRAPLPSSQTRHRCSHAQTSWIRLCSTDPARGRSGTVKKNSHIGRPEMLEHMLGIPLDLDLALTAHCTWMWGGEGGGGALGGLKASAAHCTWTWGGEGGGMGGGWGGGSRHQ